MSTADRGREAVAPNLVSFPPDYPHSHRYQNGEFFRAALFGVSRAAFCNYQRDGLIPPPDARLGRKSAWRETTIANAVAAFAARSVA
ncbi:MAG: hypothetical protein AB1582_12195 [Pseudomonadota bacterium]